MFRRKFRLPRNKIKFTDFLNTPLFSLKFKDNNLLYNRYAFVVSKKTDKHATVRNKIKRLFRSCVEDLDGQIQKGYDMLFILKKEILGKDREIIYSSIKKSLSQKELMK